MRVVKVWLKMKTPSPKKISKMAAVEIETSSITIERLLAPMLTFDSKNLGRTFLTEKLTKKKKYFLGGRILV